MKSSTSALFLLVLAAAAASASACSGQASRAALPSGAPAAPAELRVGMTAGGALTIRAVPLERYVEAATLSEFAPASGDSDTVERMLEVQAVITRTYAIGHLGRHAREGYDVCDRTHCQLFQPGRLTTSRWAPHAADAVRRTKSEVLWFDGAPALAVYHADCGGRTSAAADVWGGTLRPYLVSRTDDGPAAGAHMSWRYDATRGDVTSALNGDSRTRVGRRFDGIEIVERDAAGRAQRIALRGTEERLVRADVLREVLARAFGARSIRSTWFEVRREQGRMVFEGRGFGHGVGLCQAGALARIRAGAKLSSILERYFPGTKLVTLG
jgi:stage II sporulation protein D